MMGELEREKKGNQRQSKIIQHKEWGGEKTREKERIYSEWVKTKEVIEKEKKKKVWNLSNSQ